jgi:hypothetical protein
MVGDWIAQICLLMSLTRDIDWTSRSLLSGTLSDEGLSEPRRPLTTRERQARPAFDSGFPARIASVYSLFAQSLEAKTIRLSSEIKKENAVTKRQRRTAWRNDGRVDRAMFPDDEADSRVS